MKKSILSALSFIFSSHLAWAGDMTGLWEEYDDDTGKVNALIRINKTADGTYEGMVEKVLVKTANNGEAVCSKCAGDLHNRPILGLRILKGMKRKSDNVFDSGEVLDPDDGRVYPCRIEVMDDGNSLQVTGYLALAWVGQSEIWVRAK
ncbi:MAG TPA: DUF2147 domain-containing protein [Methylophilaceae bacterium]